MIRSRELREGGRRSDDWRRLGIIVMVNRNTILLKINNSSNYNNNNNRNNERLGVVEFAWEELVA